jgi:integrase
VRIKRHYEHDGEGHLAWPEEVIEVFDQDCPPHLQFIRMGLQYTGQRGGDVVKMRWQDFDGRRIYVVQEKTGKKLWLNCPKPLLIALQREQRTTNREFIFHHAYDAPYANAQTMSHAIRRSGLHRRADHVGARSQDAEDGDVLMPAGAAERHERNGGREVGPPSKRTRRRGWRRSVR